MSARRLQALIGTAALLVLMWVESRSLAIAGIHVYQHALAPLATRLGATCRFEPSCSRYAEIVITREGVVAGGWKTIKRVVRCGPWTRMGTRDEP